MTSSPEARDSLYISSASGAARGIFINSVTYPLEVVKNRLQIIDQPVRVRQVSRQIFRDYGVKGFYYGFSSRLVQVVIKQSLSWPLLILIPPYLKSTKIIGEQPPIVHQAVAASAIATLDTILTTPLEKKRVLSIARPDERVSQVITQGWRGSCVHWSKLMVGWGSFLCSQQFLKDRVKASKGRDELTVSELTGIGMASGLFTAFVAAPLDLANTRRQSRNVPLKDCFRNIHGVTTFWVGWRLQAASGIINSIASVILIDYLSYSDLN